MQVHRAVVTHAGRRTPRAIVRPYLVVLPPPHEPPDHTRRHAPVEFVQRQHSVAQELVPAPVRRVEVRGGAAHEPTHQAVHLSVGGR